MSASVVSAAGGGLVALVLREIFHAIFHPGHQVGLTRAVFPAAWRAAHRLGPRALALAGPAATVAMIGLWAGGLLLGWALVYWPHLPEDFVLAAGLGPSEQGSFSDALYVSFVYLTTLGLGDIAPGEDWLRLLVPLEALLGLALLTAAVSWVLSIHPALTRRRAAAAGLAMLRDSLGERPDAIAEMLPGRLESIAADLALVRVDLIQYPESYYFKVADPDLSLARMLPWLLTLTRSDHLAGTARRAAAELQLGLDRLAATLAGGFPGVGGAGTEAILVSYAEDQGDEPVGATG
jgi:hypothetical protein